MFEFKSSPGTALVLLLISLVETSCSLPGEASTGRTERHILAAVDFSASIGSGDLERWAGELRGVAADLGEELWDESSFDELVVWPVHGHTETAAPVARAKLVGGAYQENPRRRERARFQEQLEAIQTTDFPEPVVASTDLLSVVDRMAEYLEVGGRANASDAPEAATTGTIYELWLFSDMFHSAGKLDFESDPPIFTTADADAFASKTIDERGWPADLLDGVLVTVRLPGTASGVTKGISDPARIDAVERFWRALFVGLGAEVGRWGRL